jgi:hypothetical protein
MRYIEDSKIKNNVMLYMNMINILNVIGLDDIRYTH